MKLQNALKRSRNIFLLFWYLITGILNLKLLHRKNIYNFSVHSWVQYVLRDWKGKRKTFDFCGKAGWRTDSLSHPITVVNKPTWSQGFCFILSVSLFRSVLQSDFPPRFSFRIGGERFVFNEVVSFLKFFYPLVTKIHIN